MDPSAVAVAFTKHYYGTFDANRALLAPLYRPESMLTYQEAQVLGVNAIMEKLADLPFQKVQHVVSTIDTQPSITHGALIISVTGYLKVDDEQNPLCFNQVFQLVDKEGTYYVYNDIFRLNVG